MAHSFTLSSPLVPSGDVIIFSWGWGVLLISSLIDDIHTLVYPSMSNRFQNVNCHTSSKETTKLILLRTNLLVFLRR
jgi:hypothetical protein